MKLSPATAAILILVTLVHVVVIAAVSPLVADAELATRGDLDESSEAGGITSVTEDREVEVVMLPEQEGATSKSESVVLTHPLRAPEETGGEEITLKKETGEPVARHRPNQGEYAKRIKSPHLGTILRGEEIGQEVNHSREDDSEEKPVKRAEPVSRNLRPITPISGR